MDTPTIPNITGREVESAMAAAAIDWVPLRACSICGYELGYRVVEGVLAFDAGCWCGRELSEYQPRDYSSMADHHNMQTHDSVRAEFRAKIGMPTLSEENPNPE